MKSIPISEYFKIVRPEYVYFKIIPLKSARSYNSDKILNAVVSLYNEITWRVRIEEKRLFIHAPCKISYYIYMEKSKVEFYFIIPERYINLFLDKIGDVWRGVTMERVSALPAFSEQCSKSYMTYKKEDALSLDVDKRNNFLLSTMLSTLDVLEDGDRVGVLYNFVPTRQIGWPEEYDRTLQKLKIGSPIEKDKFSAISIIKTIVMGALNIVDLALDALSFTQKPTKQPVKDLALLTSTTNKRSQPVVQTQIICLSQSPDRQREWNNATSIQQSFKSISGDNELIPRRFSGEINYTARLVDEAETIKITPMEGQNLLALPAYELINEHSQIQCVDVTECTVPAKLQAGYISLGDSIYRGTKTTAYLRDTYDQGNFPLVLIGEQGSGKTTYLSHYVKSILARNEGAIVIDYIKNCELSDTIAAHVPQDKLVVLDMSDVHSVQGIGYNELLPKTNNVIDVLDVANRKALYVQMLVDALNVNGEELSTSMDRYLSAAANIVMLNQKASLKDVVRCLNDHVYRQSVVSTISQETSAILDEEITALRELDDYDKAGELCGTKGQKVDGVNHRINLLRKDLRLKMMFNKPCTDNIDLVSAMNSGKIILVKMPQEYFSTPYSKNVIVTYLFTKIWAATLIRGSAEQSPKRFHIIVDEIFQAPTAMQLLRSQEILPQTRKFGAKFVFSCQYLKQINVIDQTLRSAGASYMLMKGSGKANFNEFKDELTPYTLEDMEALPQYHSLNLINYEDGRAKFVTKLPNPRGSL